MNEPCAMGTMQQVHVDASGIPVVCMPMVCLARSAAKLSHVGWRLTRQVPKGRRNRGVREAGLVQDEYAGANHKLAEVILSALVWPP
jgi:hypothetical protein